MQLLNVAFFTQTILKYPSGAETFTNVVLGAVLCCPAIHPKSNIGIVFWTSIRPACRMSPFVRMNKPCTRLVRKLLIPCLQDDDNLLFSHNPQGNKLAKSWKTWYPLFRC